MIILTFGCFKIWKFMPRFFVFIVVIPQKNLPRLAVRPSRLCHGAPVASQRARRCNMTGTPLRPRGGPVARKKLVFWAEIIAHLTPDVFQPSCRQVVILARAKLENLKIKIPRSEICEFWKTFVGEFQKIAPIARFFEDIAPTSRVATCRDRLLATCPRPHPGPPRDEGRLF